MVPIDTLHTLQKAVNKVLTCLFAVADNVDAGILLFLDGEQGRVLFGGFQCLPLEAPRRPQFVGFREPTGLRQAAGDRGLEHSSSRTGRRPFLAAIWPPL